MSLRDITNSSSSKINKKKRLSDGTIKTYSYMKSRKQFDIAFADDKEKLVFENKLELYNSKSTIFTMKTVFILYSCCEIILLYNYELTYNRTFILVTKRTGNSTMYPFPANPRNT